MDERDLRTLLTLQAVARHGGFAAAARELGSTRAAVSRVIGEAEQRIGVRLCHRTTRRVTLTEAAASLLAEVGPGLEAVAAAWSALPDREGAYRGRIRLSSSHAFARAHVLPVVTRFLAQHPGVQVELRLQDVIDDLVARSLDIAVRLGPLPDSSLVARKAGRVAVVLVAAPALLAGARKPRNLQEAQAWPVVAFQPPSASQPRSWKVQGDDGPVVHEVREARVQADSIEGVVDLLRAGVGLGLAPRYLVAQDLAAGRLVQLLPRLAFTGPEVHVCSAHRALLPQRVKALIDLLVRELKAGLAA
jgi:DNA-binding transcriptional LysR family regulator